MILAAAFIECKSGLSAPVTMPSGAVAGAARGRIGGSPHHFSGGADHPFRLKLGERLLVLLVAPVDVAKLMHGGRRAEELVQALLEQRVLAPVLFSDPVTRRHGEMPHLVPRARLAPATVLGSGHAYHIGCRCILSADAATAVLRWLLIAAARFGSRGYRVIARVRL